MSIQAVAWALEQEVNDPAAKLVLLSLANAYNQQRKRCFPTVRQIMKEAGISEMGARRKLKVLSDLGLVRIEKSFASDGRQQANEYILSAFGEGTSLIGGGYQSDRGEGTTADRGEGTNCGTPLKEPEEIPEEGSLGASAPSAPAAPVEADQAEASCDHFEAFWSAYPKREGPNPKKPARTSYDRAVKAGATHDQLLAAVRRLASQHPNPTRFCPQAVTWLNQARFADADALPAKLPDPKAKTDADWTRHLQYARRTNLWWMDWGPMPGDPGSIVPDHLLTDYDRNQNFVKRRSA